MFVVIVCFAHSSFDAQVQAFSVESAGSSMTKEGENGVKFTWPLWVRLPHLSYPHVNEFCDALGSAHGHFDITCHPSITITL